MIDFLKSIKCFLLDMDGTFYLGHRLLPGAIEFMSLIIEKKKDFIKDPFSGVVVYGTVSECEYYKTLQHGEGKFFRVDIFLNMLHVAEEYKEI